MQGFPDAITAVFAKTVVQTRIVHLIRASMSFASWKDRKEVARELRAVCRAAEDRKWPPREWVEAKNQVAILFEERFQTV